jgi:hypothetical protein
MRRRPVALLVAALVLVLGFSVVPAAGAATKKATSCKTKKKSSKAHARSAKAKAKPHKCTKKKKVAAKPKPAPTVPKADPPSDGTTGTPVTVSVLDGSYTTLDLGRGIVRTFVLSGAFTGYLQDAYQPGQSTAMTLTRGSLAVAPTDVLTDSCPSPAISRTNPATSVNLSPNTPSPLEIKPDGTVKLTAHMIIRVVLDLRGASPCGGPTVTSGYADTPGTVVVTGQIGPAGLNGFELGSRLFPLPLRECWTPGDPTKECLGPPSPLWSTGSTHLNVAIKIGP